MVLPRPNDDGLARAALTLSGRLSCRAPLQLRSLTHACRVPLPRRFDEPIHYRKNPALAGGQRKSLFESAPSVLGQLLPKLGVRIQTQDLMCEPVRCVGQEDGFFRLQAHPLRGD